MDRQDRRRRTHLLAIPALVAGGLLLAMSVSGCSDELARARNMEEQGDMAGAVKSYSGVLEKSPDDLNALRALAVDLFFLQEYDQALPVQEHLVDLDKEDVQTRVELGFNYLNHQGRPEDAVRVLREAAALDPTAQHLTFVAQAEIVAGYVEDAELTLRRAVNVDHNYARSYSLLNGLLVETGRTEDAAAVVQLAQARGLQIEGAR